MQESEEPQELHGITIGDVFGGIVSHQTKNRKSASKYSILYRVSCTCQGIIVAIVSSNVYVMHVMFKHQMQHIYKMYTHNHIMRQYITHRSLYVYDAHD